jgi:hypothetical protein
MLLDQWSCPIQPHTQVHFLEVKIREAERWQHVYRVLHLTFKEFILNANHIQAAVHQAGGPSRVAAELRVSSRAVNTWQNKGYVPKYDDAERLAALAEIPIGLLRKSQVVAQHTLGVG